MKNDNLFKSIVKSIKFLKTGGWLEYEIPDRTHEEIIDDTCECCGTSLGKRKIVVVDSYKKIKRYFPPNFYTSDYILINPNMEKELLNEKRKNM